MKRITGCQRSAMREVYEGAHLVLAGRGQHGGVASKPGKSWGTLYHRRTFDALIRNGHLEQAPCRHLVLTEEGLRRMQMYVHPDDPAYVPHSCDLGELLANAAEEGA